MSPLSCDRVKVILSDTLDGTLFSDDLEAAAAAHLDSCSACGRTARELSSIHRLMLEDRAADLLHREKPSRKESGPVLSRRRYGRRVWLAAGSVAACLVIALGFEVMVGGAAEVVGSLKDVTGRVLRIDQGVEAPAGKGEDLRSGQGLRTEGPGSQATVIWRDGTMLELGEDTTLHRIEEAPDGKRVSLAKGSLKADVARQEGGRPMKFTTPQGEAKVLGTSLRISADADPATGTRLEVTDGRVELRNPAGKAVTVESGQFAVSAKGVELVARKVETAWKNVTGAVGGEAWGFGGIHTFATVPGRDLVIAGVSNSWLWSSADGGETWTRMGNDGHGPIQNRPHQILFDPKDSSHFWVSGIYGPGIFKTTDGGRTFRRLGNLDHIDGLAIDFADPARRTLLASHHLHDRGLYLSVDEGETWEKIGDRLPGDKVFPSDSLILDSNTFLVNSMGARNGIYRSVDAGRTWTKVSDVGPRYLALVASNGALFWQGVYGSGLVRSLDRGATWTKLQGPVRTNVIETPDGRVVGAGGHQLFVSADGGTTWEKLGGPIPVKPAQVIYSPEHRAFYVRWMSDGRVPDAIFRWILPD